MENNSYIDMKNIISGKQNASMYEVFSHADKDSPCVFIMRGLPGSGKSTIAREWVSLADNDGTRAVVSRDDFRSNMFLSEGIINGEGENVITAAVDAMISSSVSSGVNVVVDATHLRRSHAVHVARTAYNSGSSIYIVDVKTPVDSCVDNDDARSFMGYRHVGYDTIMKMHKKFFGWENESHRIAQSNLVSEKCAPYVCTSGIDTPVTIFDIDGTLALMNGRDPYDWDNVGHDILNEPVARQLHINREAGHDIIIFSGRKDICRAETEKWLKENGIIYTALFMRSSDDNRSDDIVKREMLHEVEKNYGPVVGVFDDRNKVVDMFRSIGLTVFQVNYGDF